MLNSYPQRAIVLIQAQILAPRLSKSFASAFPLVLRKKNNLFDNPYMALELFIIVTDHIKNHHLDDLHFC